MQDQWQEPKETTTVSYGGDEKAWRLVESLAQGSLQEQRSARRWKVFFRFLTFGWLFALVGVLYSAMHVNDMAMPVVSDKYTALVDISGQIGGGDVEADNVVTSLRAAFKDKGTQAVVLRINSPGGSPVQSGYIYDEIQRLRDLHPDTKLYAVIVDIGASGGYYIASAADEIYADKASLVGSIGVISSGFGFVKAMDKLGITRRTYTAGENKAFLDPFESVDQDAAGLWQESLDTIHQQFIDAVKEGRGERLKDNPDIFTGMVWSGEKAKELGLIDGLGSTGYVAREIIGEEYIQDFTLRLTPLEEFARNLGAGVSAAFVKVLGADLVLK